MIRQGRNEEGLEGLLDLDRQTMEVGEGYWVTMRVNRVPESEERPHGIQYALTLHRPGGQRIMGYDNAHRPPARSGPSRRSKRAAEFDHVHHGEKTKPYTFTTPGKLLEDFWADVEATLQHEGIK